MIYQDIHAARFLARPNRFIAQVELEGRVETVHVKNTGRCKELLLPGCTVYLEGSSNPARRTKYDLVAVEKARPGLPPLLINMDAQAPNKVFGEWAAAGRFLPEVTVIRPEYTWEDSRFDFRLETPAGPCFVEVKGVTLEENGRALFPDAPTERGVEHLRGLARAVEQGYRAAVFFVVQMKGPKSFSPNDATHPAFGEALRRAAAAGVEVCAYDCRVTPSSLVLDAPVFVVCLTMQAEQAVKCPIGYLRFRSRRWINDITRTEI